MPQINFGDVQLHNKLPTVIPPTSDQLQDVRELSNYGPVDYKMFLDDRIGAQEPLQPTILSPTRHMVRMRVEDGCMKKYEYFLGVDRGV